MAKLISGPWEHVAVAFKEALTSRDYLLVVILMNTQGLLKMNTKSTSMKLAYFLTLVYLRKLHDNGSFTF